MTDFSVLLPVYAGDRVDHFERAFRSVAVEQQLAPSQIVLVQDGPIGEELAAVVERLMATSPVPVDLVVLPDNEGLAAALRAGLARADHEIVARMDADDISLPERFARQIPAIVGGLDLVGSALHEFDEDEVAGRFRPAPTGAEAIQAQARLRSPFHHPTVVFRVSAVQRAGGYRELGMMEDYWLWARMLMSGARVDNLSEAFVLYRVGDGAYARRGGWGLLRSELALQRAFADIGFTSRAQRLRNVLVRGIYRLVPERIRKVGYRSVFARRRQDDSASP